MAFDTRGKKWLGMPFAGDGFVVEDIFVTNDRDDVLLHE